MHHSPAPEFAAGSQGRLPSLDGEDAAQAPAMDEPLTRFRINGSELAVQLAGDRGHVARFDEIAHYLARWQPPALMLWGRHDVFFDLAETLSWMQALPRMEAHILDGGHFLLETHAEECARLMGDFLRCAPLLAV